MIPTNALRCAKRVHCLACRTDAAFRQTYVDRGFLSERDFACPFGVTAESITPQPAQFRVKVRKKGCGTCPPLEVTFRAGT